MTHISKEDFVKTFNFNLFNQTKISNFDKKNKGRKKEILIQLASNIFSPTTHLNQNSTNFLIFEHFVLDWT